MSMHPQFVELHNRYEGRIFLLGSGHSLTLLTAEDKMLLEREYTFAGARYFKWNQVQPSFYIVAEDAQMAEWQERGFAQASAKVAKFAVEWQPAPLGWIPVARPESLSYHHYTNAETSLSSFEGECAHIHMAHDVPLAALQVARYMGFTEFYLLGCETTESGYAWDVHERRKVRDRSGTMIPMYAKAKREVGGRLYDCTPAGKLNKALGFIPVREVLAR